MKIKRTHIVSSHWPSDSQGELIVYPYAGVRPSVPLSIFVCQPLSKKLLGFHVEPPWEGVAKSKSLYKLSGSHDQDGHHAYIYLKQ